MIIDGIKIAGNIEKKLAKEVKKLRRQPLLAAILIGRNPASEIYVRQKEEACERIGVKSIVYRLPAKTNQKELISLIKKINKESRITGLLVQLPLPLDINEIKVFEAIDKDKDIDGLNPINIGLLESGQALIVPPTAAAVIEIIRYTRIELKRKIAVLIGFSELVGKPLVPFLIDQGATVTICHKVTRNLAEFSKKADLLIVAVGKPNLVKASMAKRGATIIDVGINRIGGKVVGDVDFNSVKKKSRYITPVPGGVGPLTVAMLLKNLIQLTKT